MSTNSWTGGATAIAMVETYTPASVTVGNIFTLTSGNSTTVVYTAAVATAADVVTGLLALLNSTASPPPPEFADITWSGTTTLIGTAKTSGKPFTITSVSATGSGSGGSSFGVGHTVANSGPNDVSVAANWSLGVPVSTQDIVIAGTSVSLLYNLDQHAIVPNTVTVAPDFTGQIGLPIISPSGYSEYRKTYWMIGGTSVVYAGTGTRARLDFGSTTTTITVNNTGSSVDSGLETLLLKGSALTLVCNKGSVGVAVQTAETATVSSSTKIGQSGNVLNDSKVRFGSGVTFSGTLTINGGTVETNSAPATVKLNAGKHTHKTGAIGTSYVNAGGTFVLNATGAVASYTGFGGQDVIDLTQSTVAKTLTACTINAGSTLKDTFRTGVYTAGIILNECGLNDVTLDVGSNVNLAPTFI